MGKKLIGKRVRVQVGGEPPPPDDAIVGEDISVHVPEEDVEKYSSIIGEKVELVAGGEVDSVVRDIRDSISRSDDARRDEIIAVCEEILAEKDREKKAARISTLITIGAKVATIAGLILQLRQALGG